MRSSLSNIRFGTIALAALLLAACGDRSVLAVGGNPAGNTDRSSLVGSWRFTRYLIYRGQEMLSETTWRFESSGAATRTLATTNLSFGVGDIITRSGRWELAGSSVRITFPTATIPETLSFRVTRESADRIWLDDIPFIRIAP